MDLSPVKTSGAPVDEKLWLGSRHGTDCTRSITIDVGGGTFDALIVDAGDGSGYGYIPSGTPVAEGATPGQYVLATDSTPGPVANDGHLIESVRVRVGSTTVAGASLLWHGVVVAAQVPVDGFTAADGATDHILYV